MFRTSNQRSWGHFVAAAQRQERFHRDVLAAEAKAIQLGIEVTEKMLDVCQRFFNPIVKKLWIWLWKGSTAGLKFAGSSQTFKV